MIYRFKINLTEKVVGNIKVLPMVYLKFSDFKNDWWQNFDNKRYEPEVIPELLNENFYEISDKDFYLEVLKHTIIFNVWDYDNLQYDYKAQRVLFQVFDEEVFTYEKNE